MGYLSDDRIGEGLLPFLSVKENLTIINLKSIKKGLFISSFMEKKVAEKMISSLKIITPSLSQRLAFLSGGNQQKVYIAKWLLAEASILIFHGPTIGVDVGTRRQIYYLIRSLAEEGKSIIIVSYEAEEVYDICDRVEVLWKGLICKTVIPGETLFKDFIYYITHGSGGENIVS
ncbi:Ribose import ATP-binding protein RbsA [subsurface metagenome]